MILERYIGKVVIQSKELIVKTDNHMDMVRGNSKNKRDVLSAKIYLNKIQQASDRLLLIDGSQVIVWKHNDKYNVMIINIRLNKGDMFIKTFVPNTRRNALNRDSNINRVELF